MIHYRHSVSFVPSLILRRPSNIGLRSTRKAALNPHEQRHHVSVTVARLLTIEPRKKKTDAISIERKKVKVVLPKFWTAALIELFTGCFAITVCKLCGFSILGSAFSFTTASIIQSFQLAIPFSIAFWMLEFLPTGLKQVADKRFKAFFGSRSILDVAIFCVCVSFGEEFLFRSCLLGGLCAVGLQSYVALTISAIIFGILHAYTKLYMLLASIAGFLFGLMFIYSSSILQPMVVHFLYDFITIMIMKLRWQSSSK